MRIGGPMSERVRGNARLLAFPPMAFFFLAFLVLGKAAKGAEV